MPVPRSAITGLVLAGGRGARMGGLDKGLQLLRGRPLIEHALAVLVPQVDTLLISANRHVDAYRRYGHPVLPDATADHPGPLAGIAAGLAACSTPWLAVVPCDAPDLPADLVARLADGLDDRVEVVSACVDGRSHPVCCLLSVAVQDDLIAAIARGEYAVGRWMASRRHREIPFADATRFRNLNHLADLDDES